MRMSILTVPALVFCMAVNASDTPKPFPRDEQGNVVFQGVVSVANTNATDLYANAKFWASKAFKDSRWAIHLDDTGSGRMVIKGSDTEPFGVGKMVFNFVLTIEVKADRYRWTINQLQESIIGGYHIEKSLTKDGVGVFGRKGVYESFRQSMEDIGTTLEVAMKSPAAKDADF